MEIRARSHSKHLLLTGALILLALGLGLSFVTWQNLRHQQRNVFEHLLLSSRTVLRGVEGNLVREMRGRAFLQGMGRGMGRGHMGPGADMPGPMPGFGPGSGLQSLRVGPQARDLFMDLAQARELTFVALYSPGGKLMVTSAEDAADPVVQLPEEAWQGAGQGEWHALLSSPGRDVFVAAARVRPLLGSLCAQDETLQCEPGEAGFPILVVGLDATPHMAQYNSFRRTAVLQTVYALLATAVLSGLGLAYLRRREQGLAFRRLERFHSRLLDTMPDGLLTLDHKGVIQAANPAAMRLLAEPGTDGESWDDSASGLLGRRWDDLDLSEPEERGRGWVQYEAFGRSLEILSMPIPGVPGDERAESGDQGGSLVLVRDRTDMRALEKDLEEAERLAAIGRLAAGLAHEIRNPLSSLRGFAQYFQGKLKGREPEEEYADTMVREADRVDKVVTDLLFLAKPREAELETVDLAAMAEDLSGLLRLDLEARGATLEIDLAASSVRADRDLLKQALLNLLLNALAALPEQGGRVRLVSRQRQDAVELAVEDNGAGMDEQARVHALEPFFTTRKKGTGLGLAIVHKIMRDHGGGVSLESAMGGPRRGTVVRLAFPWAGGEQP